MDFVSYEQPLNERIRMLLRLQFLFEQGDHALLGTSSWDSRVAMTGFIEFLNVLSRSDLKTELIKELERLSAALTPLERNPGVDRGKLTRILDETDLLIDRLHGHHGQLGQELKDNEFLNSIKQRSSIPGGTCEFDLPAFHYWLQRPAEQRTAELRGWMGLFDTVREATDLILRLVRESAPARRTKAPAGFYQQSLDSAAPVQLIRVILPAAAPYFAEISGGKHRFTVRFMEMAGYDRPAQTAADVEFALACCII